MLASSRWREIGPYQVVHDKTTTEFLDRACAVTFTSLPVVVLCSSSWLLKLRIVIFRKRSIQPEFLDIFYCEHVTYQIWAWLKTFKGNVNWTNTANFDAHWTSGVPKKGGFEISLATDSNRLIVKFVPPLNSLEQFIFGKQSLSLF